MTEGPDVRLDPEAARWVAQQGAAITLRASPRHGCCGGTAILPVAEARTPEKPEAWLIRKIDGVTVYVDPAMVEHPGSLMIRTEGFLRWRRLFVEGTGLNARG